MAMDELERAMLDPRVNPACSSRIFLHMMPELTAEPKDVVAEWKNVSKPAIVAIFAIKSLHRKNCNTPSPPSYHQFPPLALTSTLTTNFHYYPDFSLYRSASFSPTPTPILSRCPSLSQFPSLPNYYPCPNSHLFLSPFPSTPIHSFRHSYSYGHSYPK